MDQNNSNPPGQSRDIKSTRTSRVSFLKDGDKIEGETALPIGRTSIASSRELSSGKPTVTRRLSGFSEGSHLTSHLSQKLSESTIVRARAEVEVAFKNYTFEVKTGNTKALDGGKRVILNDITGLFRRGRLTAIMGPSGSGKTSLIENLAGKVRAGQVYGQVLLNGTPSDGEDFRSLSGFVHQDDVLMETMTVREAIEMSAILRLPSYMAMSERQRRVEDVMTLLNLTKISDSLIGGGITKSISGGEKKRVAIAMDLIINPPILLLDEPTTGLDGFTAYTVILSLSSLAKQGRTVVTTIHQPSSEIFSLFDDLLLLVDGSIMYLGPANKAVAYFERHGYPCPAFSNPADFLFMEAVRPVELMGLEEMRAENDPELHKAISTAEAKLALQYLEIETASKRRIKYFQEAWLASPEHQKILNRIDNPKILGLGDVTPMKMAPLWTQLSFLFQRALKKTTRNFLDLPIKIFSAIYLGLIVGLMFINSSGASKTLEEQIRQKSGAISFSLIVALFSGAIGVLNIFYTEKQVFVREFQSRYYDTFAYFWTRYAVELPIDFMRGFLCAVILYYLVGLNPAFSRCLFLALLLALAYANGSAVGVLMACSFDDLNIVLSSVPTILLPMIIYSGFLIVTSTIPGWLKWISYIDCIFYGFVAGMQNEFSRPFPNCDPSQDPFGCSGEQALAQFGLQDSLPMGVNVVFMVLLLVVTIVSAYLVLSILSHRRYRFQRKILTKPHSEVITQGEVTEPKDS